MLGLLAFANRLYATDVLLKNVTVDDGSGRPFIADVRVHGSRIVAWVNTRAFSRLELGESYDGDARRE